MKQKIEEIILKVLINNGLISSQEPDVFDKQLIDLGLDSLSFVKIIIELENELDIEFDDDDLDLSNFETMNNLVHMVMQKS